MEKKWWKEAVIYQIYPRSFADSNGDGVGDLNGITEHLDYLDELGIDVIWLSPVYQSPNEDNGYDISDYQSIMKDFGTMEDFDRLLAEAHRRGIRIVMDLVVNHTSDEHRWFVESRKSIDNPYRDYYIWKEPKDGGEPNNWGASFGGSAWEYDKDSNMYYLHCFSKKQPDLNWENERVRKEVYEMMRWWCDKGIDGFRMDVISMISKDPAYPDGTVEDGRYADLQPYVCNGPKVHAYLQEMNREVLSRYDLLTVGEAAGVTVDEAKRYADSRGTELGMVFQFEHMDVAAGEHGKWTDKRAEMPKLRAVLNKWQTELEGKAWNSLYWNNHDQPRAVSRFGNDSDEYRVISAKMLATCLHMMKGTPYIYQGEELGMTNAYFDKLEQYRDIESIHAYEDYTKARVMSGEEMLRCLKAVSRDNARTPMQWDGSSNGGFTEGIPWIELNPNYVTVNAKKEMEDADSIFHYYKKLIALRKKHDIIVYGTFVPLLEDDDNLYAYERTLKGEKLVAACNFSEKIQQCTIFEGMADRGTELISNYEAHEPGVLLPYEARVVLI